MELAGNKDLLQTVFDSSSNGIGVMKPIYDEKGKVKDFSILLFNNYIVDRISNKNYKGRPYTEVFPLFKETGIIDKFIEIAETGISSNFEACYTAEDTKYWAHFNVVKKADLIIVHTEDITKRKQAEIDLNIALQNAEKQQRLYDSITNNTPDLVYVFDKNYQFTYANKALLTMWGKTAQDAIGKGLRENGYEEWHALMHEREIDEIIATKKSIRGTVSFPHAELGSRVYDYILVPVLNEKGDVEAIAGTTRDITDIKNAEEKLQKSENRFRTLLQEAPVAATLFSGQELIIEIANELTLKYWGKSKDIVGKPAAIAAPELEDQQMIALLKDSYQNGTYTNYSETLITFIEDGKKKDGYYSFSLKPLFDEKGNVESMLSVGIDVTEQVLSRKKLEDSENLYKELSATLEQQVIERTKELKRSNEDLQQFAHVASHDLKEPVRKIKTFTNRLQEQLAEKLDETTLHYFERIKVSTDRMASMIDGVLVYSTINEGLQRSELVDLNEVIKNIEIDLEIPLQKNNGTIRYTDLPSIEGASVLLYQLFYNLINNSIKFAKEDEFPQITLSSQKYTNEDGAYAVITLQDNGIGFDATFAERIFDTFTRLNPKDQYEGTGLGLSLCKKIVERHNGSIIAKSKLGQGASFIITLPLLQKQIGL